MDAKELGCIEEFRVRVESITSKHLLNLGSSPRNVTAKSRLIERSNDFFERTSILLDEIVTLTQALDRLARPSPLAEEVPFEPPATVAGPRGPRPSQAL